MDETAVVEANCRNLVPGPIATHVIDIRWREAALQEIWQLMTDTRLEWAIWPNGH